MSNIQFFSCHINKAMKSYHFYNIKIILTIGGNIVKNQNETLNGLLKLH